MLQAPKGDHHRGDHEGDRLAAALGARLLLGRHRQEARAEARLGEDLATSGSIASPSAANRSSRSGYAGRIVARKPPKGREARHAAEGKKAGKASRKA